MIKQIERMRKLVNDNLVMNLRFQMNGELNKLEREIEQELNSRAERTCEWELEHSGTLYDKWRCSKCGYLFVEPRCDPNYTDMVPNYCPNCGARVVE